MGNVSFTNGDIWSRCSYTVQFEGVRFPISVGEHLAASCLWLPSKNSTIFWQGSEVSEALVEYLNRRFCGPMGNELKGGGP